MDAFKNSSPQMCGFYSITSDRVFDESSSSLRYFKTPFKFPIDLNKGIAYIKNKPNSYFQEKMDSILTYIVKNKADFICDAKKENALIPSAKFITYRGVICKIMCSPYEKRNGWCILATKYKNNIYLCQYTKPEELDALQDVPIWQTTCAAYSLKFEQYCLTDDPSVMPDPSQQIDACTQFFGVFKRMLVGHNFLFAGELDAVVSDKPVNLNKSEQLNNLKFIELKVANADRRSCSNRMLENFRRLKCQKVWTQSYLTGVEDVFFGMRDRMGIVRQIEHYPTSQLPLHQNFWSPSESFKFLDEFLGLVEAKMDKIDCPKTVFQFRWDENLLNIACTEHPGETELSLLPDWYLSAF